MRTCAPALWGQPARDAPGGRRAPATPYAAACFGTIALAGLTLPNAPQFSVGDIAVRPPPRARDPLTSGKPLCCACCWRSDFCHLGKPLSFPTCRESHHTTKMPQNTTKLPRNHPIVRSATVSLGRGKAHAPVPGLYSPVFVSGWHVWYNSADRMPTIIYQGGTEPGSACLLAGRDPLISPQKRIGWCVVGEAEGRSRQECACVYERSTWTPAS